MGRLIDADKLIAKIEEIYDGYMFSEDGGVVPKDFVEFLEEAPTVEAIPKADYENRLKADLVAVLTDFLMDIEENTSINSDDSHERNGKRLMRTEIIGMFEQKINKLKENTDGNKND